MTSDIKRFNLHNVFQTANLVGIVWNLDKEIKSRLLYYASCTAYVCHILYKTNYRRIIKENNKLISFLAANEYGRSSIFKYFYLILCFISIFFMLFYKDGRSLLKYQLGYNKMLEDLYKKAGKKYDAEMVLFITYTKHQNKGYGKKLVEKFNIDMKKENIKTIYLFTDNYCDYEMYERAGCRRVCDMGKEFLFTDDVFYQEIYLYEYEIK